MRRKIEFYSLLGGLGLTAVSGIMPVASAVGGIHHGLPIPWLIRQLGTGGGWRVEPLFLALDIAFWTALALLGFATYQHQGER